MTQIKIQLTKQKNHPTWANISPPLLEKKKKEKTQFACSGCGLLLLHLLLLQLSDGILCFLQTLAGRAALLPHHRQLPLDHVVLFGLLRPGHLALRSHARRAGETEDGVTTRPTFKVAVHAFHGGAHVLMVGVSGKQSDQVEGNWCRDLGQIV